MIFGSNLKTDTRRRSFPRLRGGMIATMSVALVSLLLLTIAIACQVPVFRYALERWEPDDYVVAVVGADQLDETQRQAVDFLKSLRSEDADVPANLRVFEIPAAEAEPPPKPGPDELPLATPLPRLELFYPNSLRRHLPDAIWTGEVTMENAKAIAQSPVRNEVARRILEGNSAVWVLIETGNLEKDDAAEKALESHIAEAENELEIPEGVIGANEAAGLGYLPPSQAENVLQSEVPLKIDFSVARLSREDPAERVFLKMLLSAEDDLHEFADEPIAFSVFGRGRMLQPLIGKGLHLDNVMFDSQYLCGACSCQVKEENPGIDLLVAADWNAAVRGGSFVIDKVLPPLEGAGALLAAAAAPAAEAPDETLPAVATPLPAKDAKGSTADAESGAPVAPVAILAAVLLVVVAAVGVATFTMKRKAS